MSSNEPEVWYAIPSANPQLARRTLPAWRDMGYRVAVLQDVERGPVPADVVVYRDAYPGWAASVNALCRETVPQSAAIVVCGGDDMLPDPTRRAGEIASQFIERFPDGFGVMQPHGDDFANTREICGSPWLGRGWIDRAYGGLGPMPPAYFHDYADTELYWVARGLGALWSRPDLTQRHEHFTRSGGAEPAYWSRSVGATRACDGLVFLARSRARFPGHAPLPGPDGRSPLFDATGFSAVHVERIAQGALRQNGMDNQSTRVTQRLRDALLYCDTMGHTRVGVYGAGRHTKDAGAALADPPVRVECLIDDGLAGGTLWRIPIVGIERAMTLGLDAVIISSDRFEAELAARAAPLARLGAEIITLYGPAPAAGAA